MKKLTSFVFIMLFVSMAVFGVVVGNDSERAYEVDGEEKSIGNNQLKALVITGGGHLLKSLAGFQEFLNRVEMAELEGVDYDELRGLLNDSAASMASARTAYFNLKSLAALTPYNQTVINTLESFNYKDFKNTNGLNEVIFSKVEALLSAGNVTGVYENIYAKTGDILEGLAAVKQTLDKDIFPGIPPLWKINHIYFDNIMFGQYVAMIFSNLK